MKRSRSLLSSGITDMTTGNPYKLILLFSIPLLIGNIFQQMYNMVDSIVVGNIVGEKALAAVGTAFPIVFMTSSLFMGIGVGATIMISQYYGAQDMENIQNTVDTIYTATMVGIIPVAILAAFLSEPVLRLMQVPDDGTLQMAKTYLIVIFVGILGGLGYNINAGVLQGLGDSRTSVFFLLIAMVINIVLDLVFVLAGMGVFGVAFATIIAQLASWLFGIRYINKHYSFIHIRPFSLRLYKPLFWQVVRLGVPSGLQQALFSMGIMVMQSLVNGYGSSFMAGFNGANKIDTFAFMPIQSFTTAITTYVGQNIGAGRVDRVKQGTRAGLILSVGCSILIGGLLFPLSGYLMQMFTQIPDVIASGVSYLHCVLPFYSLLAISFIYSSALRGAGEMIVPLLSSVVSLWLVRVPVAYWIASIWGKDYIFLSYAIGWLFGVVISYTYYRLGRWIKKGLVSSSNKNAPAS